ncbi:FadR/GntR family transcriptional regulator [Virgibacillus ndiopensis]|uniref:FadR/GntR family transcriptional regulator n=1 Tax=Virgibacillus ndiopensis TaxID=2004408 RepID=UPI00159B95F4|nr:FadR/GntR family transcriptional regulator [Virgibacillus ndiopensis]
MFKSINEERKTFSKKIVEHVKNLIITEQLKPGDKLPAERQLAEMMNVSRPTVREAFKILSAMGFLTIKQGHGVVVADETARIDNLASYLFLETDTIRELFEVRKTIETQTSEWAAKRGKQDFLEQISEMANETYDTIVINNKYSVKEELETFLSQSDQKFHLMIAEAAGNEVIIRIMNNLIDLLRKSRLQSMRIPGRVTQSLKEHIKIADAIVGRDAKLARKSMLEHLRSVEQDLIKELDETGNSQTSI